MNKVKFIFWAVCFVSTTAFTQPSISIGGSVGYYRVLVDGYDDLPLNGAGFSAGVSGLIPMTDIAQFGIGAAMGYSSGSAKDEYGVELNISSFNLNLSPGLRLGFGEEKNTYADIDLSIGIPLYNNVKIKVPGYGTTVDTVLDAETSFAVGLSGRYNVIGAGIGKVLTGRNGATILRATVFIPLSEQFEIGPSISYSFGKDETQLVISLGAEYTF